MTQSDQLLASLAVLRRQWRQRIVLEAIAWMALAAVIAVVCGYAVTRVLGPAGTGLVVMRVLAYGLIVGTLLIGFFSTHTAPGGRCEWP